jgi:hypothetical protein
VSRQNRIKYLRILNSNLIEPVAFYASFYGWALIPDWFVSFKKLLLIHAVDFG